MRIFLAIIVILAGGVFGKVITNEHLGNKALEMFARTDPGVQGDDIEHEKLIISAVFTLIESTYLSDIDLDDNYSHKVFDTYLKRLDESKRFFTQADVDTLDMYRDQIDDAIRDPNLEFFERSLEIMNRETEKVKNLYPEILAKPFDFSKQDSIELDGDKLQFPADDAAMEARWRAYLKYETLTRLADKLEEQEKPDTAQTEKKSYDQLEADAREDVHKLMDDWFKRLSEVRRSDRFELYINSATNVFDPHTEYFNPKEKEDFNINMSGRLEGIGARLSRTGDYTKVVSVVPGGPAWRQGELAVDDVIYSVAQEGEAPVDIQGMHIDDVVSMIRGKKGTVVILVVKSAEGISKTIRIVRDEVILDEGFARSAILEYPGKVSKVGYIDLPKFYADFENPDGRSCAVDVANELEKLKKQNVEGIILDLRDNSGGSLNDVVQMSGLFIKDGPIVQVEGRRGTPYVYRDKDPEVRYSGPLVVMVNGYSASASEILAAALQDYGRAIIVGGKSTFGKGSVQRFYNLNRDLRGLPTDDPLGDLKLTVQKFYRINGGSTQLKGVTPDIEIPDRFKYIETGEKELDFPLPWTEINPIAYSQDVADLSNLDVIKQKSENRVAQSPEFALVDENAQRIKQLRDQSVFPMQLDAFRKMLDAQEADAKKYKNIFPERKNLTVYNPPEDLDYIQMDSSRIGRNEAWIKGIRKDGYIDETLSIIHDMIHTGVAVGEAKKED